jgi:LPS sulfotransferase NodH
VSPGEVPARLLAGARSYAAAPLFRWRAPGRRFVILTTARTGSELLVELLDSHPDIRCDSEILARPPRAPGRYVRSRAVQQGARARAYGFKLMAHHVQPGFYSSLGDFVAELRAADFTVVVLRRQRLLDQALSFLAATQIGYHPRRADGVAVDRLAVDAADLVFALVLLEQHRAALEAAIEGVAHHALSYEDDLGDPAAQQATVDRLCDRLGVPHAGVTSDLVRPAPGGLAGRVADPAALAAALRATRFAGLADQLERP